MARFGVVIFGNLGRHDRIASHRGGLDARRLIASGVAIARFDRGPAAPKPLCRLYEKEPWSVSKSHALASTLRAAQRRQKVPRRHYGVSSSHPQSTGHISISVSNIRSVIC